MASILDTIKQIAQPNQIDALAAEGFGPKQRPAVNSHIHLPPNFSAFDTVEQAVGLAAEQNVQIVGLSNYYDYAVYEDFGVMARHNKIFPLFGLEIISMQQSLLKLGVRVNDPANPGKTYICGKGITRFNAMTPRAEELINTIRKNDAQRMAEMTRKLADVFERHNVKTGLDEAAIIGRVARRHQCNPETVYLQERHLAQAFQEVLFEQVPLSERKIVLESILGPVKNAADAVGVQGQIRSSLMKSGKSCFAPEAFLTLAQAKELIGELGGIACYPILADGAEPMCEFENPVEKLIETLRAESIPMVELVPIRNNPQVLRHYATAIRNAGIPVVAGTEHNTLDVIPMEPTCVGG
ncbi:MAG: hypothetical protein JXB18_12660, partial [Sedimentisphaerales bacterium]|nr:hypothetical protein [Sedimentisphaerales bacterium]